MTIHVEWKGKIGYGDIISPISYAHNLSDKLSMPVLLTFHWPHGPDQKTYPDDPESIDFRAMYMHSLMKPAEVAIEHVYYSTKEFDPDNPHTNYEYQENVHNLWWSTITHHQTNDRVVICPTTANSEPLARGKKWKDPVDAKWDTIRTMFDADVVSYKTPINELVEKLRNCKVFIGYHGSCAWVARHLRVPSIIFSSIPDISQSCFPSKIQSQLNVLDHLDRLILDSELRIDDFDKKLQQYKFRPTVVKRLTIC